MVKVGGAYRDGWGVLRDPAEAARWLRSSAQAGEVDGQNLLGVMIAMGEATGTRRDAYVWFLLAERGGHPDATKNLGVLRPLLSPEEMADGDRRAAEWRPVPPR
jgi:TPR repeat protein